MATCSACNAPLDDGARFCRACGAPVASSATPQGGADRPTNQLAPTLEPGASRSGLTTLRFAMVSVLLVVLIGSLGGVMFVLLHSHSKNDAAPPGTKSSTSGTVSITTATVTATATDTVPKPPPSTLVPSLDVEFGPPSVVIDATTTVVVRETNGTGISDATLTVDGVPVSTLTTTTKTWKAQWRAPARDGSHLISVQANADGVSLNKTKKIKVVLPLHLAYAVNLSQQYVNALADQNLAEVNRIKVGHTTDLSGYADVTGGHVFYVGYTEPRTDVYDVRLAYVVHQTVPSGELDANQTFTAFICVTWQVDETHPPPNLAPQLNTVFIEQRPMKDRPGNAPSGFVPYSSYTTRLDKCQ